MSEPTRLPVPDVVPDSGPYDAGPTDAGVVPDTGPRDAGAVDAGPQVARVAPDPVAGVVDRPDLSPPGVSSRPPAPVEVNGQQLPDDDASLLVLVEGLVQGSGVSGVYQLSDALHTQLAAVDQEITGAHQFADAVANGYQPAAGVPWSEQMFIDRGADRSRLARVADALDRQLQVVLDRYSAFQQLVLDAAVLRLDGNRAALGQWKDYLRTELTPGQLQRQVQAEQQRSTIATVAAGPSSGLQMEALDRQATLSSPRRRAVEGRVARGLIHGGCEYCHEMQHAINTDYEHPELFGPSVSPDQLFRQYASAEGGNPAPLPGFLSTTPDTGIDPQTVAPFPHLASEVQAIERIRPILRQLGPEGFKVIDLDTGYAGMDYTQLLTTLDSAIDTRRANFALLQGEIRAGSVDFLVLRPIVRELLPLADPTVHAMIEQRIAAEQSDSEAESILIGIATVAALLLTIFPPTAMWGLALDLTLGGYGIASGVEQLQQGELLSLGIGSSVLDAEQQEAAHSLMTMGALSIVLSAAGIAMSGLSAVRMIRSGTGAAAVLEGAEAQAGGMRITLSELNTSSPRALVVAEDGTVIADQTLAELSLTRQVSAAGPSSNLPALPADVLDAAIDALDADNPFTLAIGERRAAQIRSGAKDFALDRPAGFDVDEPLAVGGDISRSRAVQRAMDPHNRQLLDPATNQLTKYLGVSPETVMRSRMTLAPVSVVDNPNVLFTRRFDEITEMAEIFEDAMSRVENIRSLSPGAIKTRINANIRKIIGEGLSPAGVRVRDALRSVGYEYVPGRGIVAVRGLTPPTPLTPLP
ncbi:hypothetical protein [Flexivirga oryzae]|uniref:Uncharacterized protein n=1 Tax=Flexivirga oryzae TaxID=1794944 RepID=A0A839N673_9MICO|nr:hypothetical protein [Flexivirga oryzae]MBB2890222.1 hypothetical protein [Flexivirga oryzae]